MSVGSRGSVILDGGMSETPIPNTSLPLPLKGVTEGQDTDSSDSQAISPAGQGTPIPRFSSNLSSRPRPTDSSDSQVIFPPARISGRLSAAGAPRVRASAPCSALWPTHLGRQPGPQPAALVRAQPRRWWVRRTEPPPRRRREHA
eukprot:scaffold12165_cov102-Isochrysis_galbana.AAC.4